MTSYNRYNPPTHALRRESCLALSHMGMISHPATLIEFNKHDMLAYHHIIIWLSMSIHCPCFLVDATQFFNLPTMLMQCTPTGTRCTKLVAEPSAPDLGQGVEVVLRLDGVSLHGLGAGGPVGGAHLTVLISELRKSRQTHVNEQS